MDNNITQAEQQRLTYYRGLAERFLGRGKQIPWRQCAGPTTWNAIGIDCPLYVWEVETHRMSASDLIANADKFIHDAETATGGQVKVFVKNHIGFGVVFDERGYPPIDILAELRDNKYNRITGGTGAGKTTLLAHLIEQEGWETIALYPKKYNGNFPASVQVVGSGGNWQEIDYELDRLIKLMYLRDEGSDPLYVIFEDWRLWVGRRELIGKMKELLVAGRESNLYVTMINQSQRVKGSGFDGEGDLFEAFVHIHLHNVRGQHYGFVDFGDGRKHRFDHPGPYAKEQRISRREITLTQDQRVLVAWAYPQRTVDGKTYSRKSCAINKMYGILRVAPDGTFSKRGIQVQLKEWEAAGMITPAGDNTPRELTQELIKAANLKQKRT